MNKPHKLVFVQGGFLYFVSDPSIRGDDWNDHYWECNACAPYCEDSEKMRILAADLSGFDFPPEQFSVDEINRKYCPWLRREYPSVLAVFAGETIEQVTEKFRNAGIKCGELK